MGEVQFVGKKRGGPKYAFFIAAYLLFCGSHR